MNRTAILILWTTMLLLLLAATSAHAAPNDVFCRFLSGGNTSVTFTLPSTISIAANTPTGTVIATSAQAAPANPPTITCGWSPGNSGMWKESAETMSYGVVNLRAGSFGNDIFDTGIPGIGYRIKLSSTSLKAYPLDSETVTQKTFDSPASLELITTGPITSGSVIAAGDLANWQWDGPNASSMIPATFRLGNTITFTTPSCTIVTDPINVTLPTVTTSAFTGVGSVSGKTPFQIGLSCPPATAVAKITMHTTMADSHPGVIKPAGAGFAAGIGVQVLDANSNPMVFEIQTVVNPPNATTSIPYFAQYFQTAPTVSGGNVKGTVTFDIFYQ